MATITVALAALASGRVKFETDLARASRLSQTVARSMDGEGKKIGRAINQAVQRLTTELQKALRSADVSSVDVVRDGDA